MRFLKRLVLWLAASLPIAIGLGILVSVLIPGDASVDLGLAALNGAIAGVQLSLIGSIAATATTLLARDALRRAGGSECLTGAIIVYGLIFIGLGLLLLT